MTTRELAELLKRQAECEEAVAALAALPLPLETATAEELDAHYHRFVAANARFIEAGQRLEKFMDQVMPGWREKQSGKARPDPRRRLN